MSTKRLSLNNLPFWVTSRYCPRDMTCERCFMTRVGSFAQTSVSKDIHRMEKLGHILARILLECTLHAFANLICLHFCSSISLALITPFLLKFANQELLHCILAHIITHSGSCTLHFLAQWELEAQKKILMVPLSDLQVGCVYTGHVIATIWRNAWGEKKSI